MIDSDNFMEWAGGVEASTGRSTRRWVTPEQDANSNEKQALHAIGEETYRSFSRYDFQVHAMTASSVRLLCDGSASNTSGQFGIWYTMIPIAPTLRHARSTDSSSSSSGLGGFGSWLQLPVRYAMLMLVILRGPFGTMTTTVWLQTLELYGPVTVKLSSQLHDSVFSGENGMIVMPFPGGGRGQAK